MGHHWKTTSLKYSQMPFYDDHQRGKLVAELLNSFEARTRLG
jgi:hypothetical protein